VGHHPPLLALALRSKTLPRPRLVLDFSRQSAAAPSCSLLVVIIIFLFAVDRNGYHTILPGVEAGNKFAGNPNTHYTMIFNIFVFCQIFNEFNSRKVDRGKNVFRDIYSNWIFVGILAITISIQIIMVQFMGLFSSCVPLTINQWFICISLGFLSLPIGLILRVYFTNIVPYDDWELPAEENVFVKKYVNVN